ncbi:MAG: oligosaccharide flippase family protein [Bacteroidia bacterium]|jgi:O-antigen/teichoic acid export membrane protein|nr:oligosaccharide flippase family protein [Bacteroidia bacterium]
MRQASTSMVSLQKQYGYYFMWTVSNLLFPVFVFPYIARFLEPQGLGEAQFALQFSRYFMLVASLGIPIYGVRELAKANENMEERNNLCAALLRLQLITAFATSIVYIVVISFFELQVASTKLLWVAGVQVFLSWTSIEWLLVGLEAFRAIALRTLILRLGASVAMFLCIHNPSDAIWYVLIVVVSFVGGNALLWIHLYQVNMKLSLIKGRIATHLKPILILGLTQLCIIMYTVFDTVWVGLLSTAIAVGFYTTALKLSKIGIAFVTSLGNMLIPRTARSLNQSDTQNIHLHYSFLFVADLAVPMSVGLFLLAPECILLFSGTAYMPAIAAMKILAILPISIGLSNLFGMQILAVAGKDMALLISVFWGLVIHLVLALICIPINAHIGAAWAMLGAELAVLTATMVFVRKQFAIQFPWIQLLYNAFIALTFIPIIWVVREMQLPNWAVLFLSVLLCTFIYGGLQYWLFKQSTLCFAFQQLLTKQTASV